jgi:hypothetical protein
VAEGTFRQLSEINLIPRFFSVVICRGQAYDKAQKQQPRTLFGNGYDELAGIERWPAVRIKAAQPDGRAAYRPVSRMRSCWWLLFVLASTLTAETGIQLDRFP